MFTFSQKQKKAIAEQISIAVEKAFPERGGNRKLAAMVGVTPSTISQWKKGAKTPTLRHLFQLSKALHTSIHILCGFSAKREVRADDLIFKHIITLSIIGEMLEKPGKTTPATRRKLGRIEKALETLEKAGMNAD